MGHVRLRIHSALAATAVALLGGTLGILGPQSGASASAAAHKASNGGSVIVGSNPGNSLDPISPQLSNTVVPLFNIYGGLFYPDGRKVVPDLATGYKYSDGNKILTLTIRKGVKFQDGTAFNAAAVQFNLNRDKNVTSTISQDFTTVTSITAPNPTTVVIHSSVPDSHLLYVLTFVAATFIGSPTAINSEGANFGLNPVGAGPFKVDSFNPATNLQMSKWSGYYDAKSVHLSSLEYLNTGADPQVNYNDVESNSVNFVSDIGLSTPPSIFASASSNPNLKVEKGESGTWSALAINTTKPPFNNQLAREALDYCLNRSQIARYVNGGYATAAYVLSGPNGVYFPGTKQAEALMPYKFDAAKAQSIVQQLGGLSFSVDASTTSAFSLLYAEALQAQWKACGMNVTITSLSTPQGADLATGTYQAQPVMNGATGLDDPFLSNAPFSLPSSSEDAYGINSPTITNLVNASVYSNNPIALAKIWNRIWATEDKLAVNIPIVASPNYYIYARCLTGFVPYQTSAIFTNAYYKC